MTLQNFVCTLIMIWIYFALIKQLLKIICELGKVPVFFKINISSSSYYKNLSDFIIPINSHFKIKTLNLRKTKKFASVCSQHMVIFHFSSLFIIGTWSAALQFSNYLPTFLKYWDLPDDETVYFSFVHYIFIGSCWREFIGSQ